MGDLLNLKQGQPLSGALVVPVVSSAGAANGAVTIPDAGVLFVPITKAGVCALTLGVPSAAQNGVVIHFVATTANAHTVTAATIGFNAGDGGADVATFGGAIGDLLSVFAYGGEWYILNKVNITLG